MTRSRVLAAAALLATVVLGAQTWHKAFRPGGYDLTSYLLSARALWDGQSPYGLETPFPYIYPLFLAFVMVPLALLPYGAAVITWFAASVAALGVILLGPTKLGTGEGGRRWASGSELAIAATVVVTFNIIQNNLLNGQVNLFVVLCCMLAVAAARERREAAAGLWLGAGIALKLMPALLVVYFLVRGQFRAILAAVVTALVLALAPAILISGSASDVYSLYVGELLMPMLTTPEGDAGLAYSVASVVQRASGAGPALWIDVLCAAAVLGVIAALDVRIWHRRSDDLAAAAAYLAAIVLISPKSETHHLAFAIPAVALCFSRLLGEGQRAASLPALPARRSLGEGGTLLVSAVAIAAAPFAGAAEGPMITAALILLIATLGHVTG